VNKTLADRKLSLILS